MKAADRREMILQAAISLFSEKGFRGVTTRQLANAVGVSEPVLYQHFRTKKELYSAIIEHLAHKPEEGAAELQEIAEKEDDRALFQHVARRILQTHTRDPRLIRLLMFSALERHELAVDFFRKQMMNVYRDCVAQYIKRRIKKKIFRSVEPMMVVNAFAGMFHFQALKTQFMGHYTISPLVEKDIQMLTDLFLHGLLKKK
jgi:AcrR family transcriptional regulator